MADVWFVVMIMASVTLIVAACEVAVFVVIRRALTLARGRWTLPESLWQILIAGFGAVGAAVELIAVTAPFLIVPAAEGSSSIQGVTVVLSAVGWIGLAIGTVLLLAWLGAAFRSDGTSQSASGNDQRLDTKTRVSVGPLLAILGTTGAITVTVGTAFQSWVIAVGVGIPFAVVMLCITTLIAHSSVRHG
jgi:hypothetical protein